MKGKTPFKIKTNLKNTLTLGALYCAMVLLIGAGAPPRPVLVAHANFASPIDKHPLEPVVETIAVINVVTPPTTPQVASSNGGGCSLEYIRHAESHGNYGNQDTGHNGHYGAYQYAPSTWNGYGGYSNPADAPPSVQDERASKDLAAGKQSQWAVC